MANRVKSIATAVVAVPAEEPLANAPNMPGGSRYVVTLRLRTDDGTEGIGISFLAGALTRSLRHAAQRLGELAIGEDASDIDGIVRKLHDLAGGSGPGGIFALALSALEIALWDVKAKSASKPLWRLLGAKGDPVPCYASGALMRELSLDDTLRSAATLVETGFTAMKFQLGLPGVIRMDVELERARRVREAVGNDILLMCDVNQRWNLAQAIEIGKGLEPLGLTWIEDPIAHDDVAGLARLTGLLETPITAGEYLYGASAFRQMFEAKAFDIAMIDPFRASGVGGWLSIAALAESYGLKVVSHLAPELQRHMIGAIGTGWMVEYMPWFNPLYDEPAWPEKGFLTLPETPGIGVSFDERMLAKYTVEEERT